MLRTACLLALVVMLGSVAVQHARADSVSYTYDELGRLSQVTYSNGTVITYTYDTADNRTTQTITCGGSGC